MGGVAAARTFAVGLERIATQWLTIRDAEESCFRSLAPRVEHRRPGLVHEHPVSGLQVATHDPDLQCSERPAGQVGLPKVALDAAGIALGRQLESRCAMRLGELALLARNMRVSPQS